MMRFRQFLALVVVMTVVPASVRAGPQEPQPAPLGYPVTGGAAPGYVPDRLCGVCHETEYASYLDVGMGQSFFRPTPQRRIEDFSAPAYYHALSKRYYQMTWNDGRLVFHRWQLDEQGGKINAFDQPVDWVLGSGHHSRVYLYRTPLGELYQVPLAWYTQEEAWAMAPGYDRADHLGVLRRVRRECLFCHNAYPDVPEGSDAYGEPQTYPAELPGGIGCQRCHGPGGEHVRRLLAGDRSSEEGGEGIRSTLVNPGRLEPRLQTSVCYACHMQPSVASPGVRLFGLGDYAFRPGRDLADFRVRIDVREEGRAPGDRFEINHHPYRLEQSTCFRASRGKLSCLTCHDPHRKVPPEERAAHYRAACLGCHEDLGHPTLASGPPPEQADCTVCHMPARRTEDVVHVVMTDHRIQRDPGDRAALLAPRKERDPDISDVVLGQPDRAPDGARGQVYRAVAVVRAGVALSDALDYLKTHLAEAAPDTLEPWLDLAEGQLKLQRWADAETTLRHLLQHEAGHPLAREWLALTLAGRGDLEGAASTLQALVDERPERPEAEYNLGRILLEQNHHEGAADHLRRATELRPNLAAAWFQLGRALVRLDRFREAEEALRRSLAIDPSEARAYAALADVLGRLGQKQEALRWLRHGLTASTDPEPLRRILSESSLRE